MLATQKPADAPKLSAYVLYPSPAIKSGTGPTGQASDTSSQVKLFKSCCNPNSSGVGPLPLLFWLCLYGVC